MESNSLFKESVALTPEALKDKQLILGYNSLAPLLSPHSQDPNLVLKWLDEDVIGNPYFDQLRATALRTAVATFYEVNREPIEGLAGDEQISLTEAFKHPGIQAKKAKLAKIFEKIGPVVRATQKAVLEQYNKKTSHNRD
ncbi:MAG: hypothetical protein K9M51_00915 [Candidatus Gracilibacteria bacterium]|nr:hypothetical protein [Candidatus Gracilibacteria bacterium]